MNTSNNSPLNKTLFTLALDFVLAAEGGVSDDPADAGGLTKYGISQKSYPDIDISTLTLDDACRIYYQDYWLRCRCDELPDYIAVVVFDTAVNMGQRQAARLLQQALGVQVDGILGPRTRAASFLASSGQLLADYLGWRAASYCRLAGTGDNRRFIRGWLTRCHNLQQYLYEEQLL